MNRFQDQNITVHNFDNKVFVECPKCSERGIITKDDPNSFWSERKFKCPKCFYSENGRKESYSVELNCNCSNCATEIKVNIPNVNEKKEILAIKCQKCGKTEKYEPRNIPQEWKYKNTNRPSDNYFGLPLWLTYEFRGNIFWAFNYEHLEYLKKYIGAELRERRNRTHWTMVEILPEWMKSGKNREKLIKLIEELEKK